MFLLLLELRWQVLSQTKHTTCIQCWLLLVVWEKTSEDSSCAMLRACLSKSTIWILHRRHHSNVLRWERAHEVINKFDFWSSRLSSYTRAANIFIVDRLFRNRISHRSVERVELTDEEEEISDTLHMRNELSLERQRRTSLRKLKDQSYAKFDSEIHHARFDSEIHYARFDLETTSMHHSIDCKNLIWVDEHEFLLTSIN